jgi:hypothetical protein
MKEISSPDLNRGLILSRRFAEKSCIAGAPLASSACVA